MQLRDPNALDARRNFEWLCRECRRFLSEFPNISRRGKFNLRSNSQCRRDRTILEMSTKTTTGAEKFVPRFKEPKERLTVLCCANASGTYKIKFVVIGKSKKPRAFKNINTDDLPVVYYSQKSAWMNKDVFTENKWAPEVKAFLASKGIHQRAV